MRSVRRMHEEKVALISRNVDMRRWLSGISIACTAMIAACSGGVSGIAPNAPASTANALVPALQNTVTKKHDALGKAKIIVRIPLRKKSRRLHPGYVSPSTESMTVAIQGGTTQTFNLTPGSTGCSKNATTGYLTCQEAMVVPSGQQTLTFTLYDRPYAVGNQLSTATTSVLVAKTGFTPIPITLDGVIASLRVLIGGNPIGTIPIGTPTSMPIEIDAYDADNNLIIPPGNYSTPISVTNSDQSGATSFTAPASQSARNRKVDGRRLRPMDSTTVTAPGKSVTLYYTGYPAPGAVEITASLGATSNVTSTASMNFSGSTVTQYGSSTGVMYDSNIVQGADGAMWFTVPNQNIIGRITSTGSTTQYSVPTAGSWSQHLTLGPDKAVWFAELYGSKIGRITTSGSFTEYNVPSLDTNGNPSNPRDIITGPDGALWFTDCNGSYIDRMTTAGVVTSETAVAPQFIYSGGSSPTNVQFLAAGADGAVWFTGGGSNQIGRITTNLAVTYYNIPSGRSAESIVSGADGALWFWESNGATSAIGRMSTSGTVTQEYPITVGNNFTHILSPPVLGGDGAIWFGAQENAFPFATIDRITTNGTEGSAPIGLVQGQQAASPLALGAGSNSIWAIDSNNKVIDEMNY